MFGSTHRDVESAEERVHEYQKWIHINLGDFRSASAGRIFSYVWLWFLGIIAVLVYAADTYTAVILLAFNRWPGQIAPAIPFSVSRWIFAICIIFSWLLLGYQWLRAIRVIRRGSVAKDYLDPLAAQFQSMRSWRRFLVFAELTQSKKGVDYVALFSYFQFQGAVRIVIAQGPRQAINAITLYAVMQAVLLPDRSGDGTQFFNNVKVLAQTQHEHAVILFTMLFTLVIWAVSALCLIFSCFAYVLFLWHYVGHNLSRYCKRKIEKRLKKIVATAIEKELARQQRLRDRAGSKRPGLFSRSNSSTALVHQPTLPDVFDEKDYSDAMSISTTVTRQPSVASSTSTLTSFTPPHPHPWHPPPAPAPPPRAYSVGTGHSQPKLAREPTLPCIEESPSLVEPPSRKGSNTSMDSSGSDDQRPLLTTRTTESSDTLPPGVGGTAGMYPRPLNVRRKPVSGDGYVAARGGGRQGSRSGSGSSGAGSGPKTFEEMGIR